MTSDPNDPCLFCTARDVTHENALAYATRDTYPVSSGHTLIIPRRHCADFFDLGPEELAACMELVVAEQRALSTEMKPDGYNIGVNVGSAGGQSIRPARHVEAEQPDSQTAIGSIEPDVSRLAFFDVVMPQRIPFDEQLNPCTGSHDRDDLTRQHTTTFAE